jgi:uncharacterized paraquat-inducible protein A
MNRRLLLILHIASLVLLAFGWTLDILTIRIMTEIPFIGRIEAMDETRSVFGTLRNLWDTGNIFPFILIALFGIAIPLIKTFLIFRVLLLPAGKTAVIRLFINHISKWAMADVFAIGILVSFLAANAMDYTTAILRPGFYYFTAYVLLSNCVVMFLPKAVKPGSE